MNKIYECTLAQCTDVELKPNISRAILAVTVMICGVAFFIITHNIEFHNSQISHSVVVLSAIIIAWGFHLLFSNKSQLVYEPSMSKLKHHTLRLRAGDDSLSRLSDLDGQLQNDIENHMTANGSIRIDYLISTDKKFAVIQLFDRFDIEHRFCTPIHVYHDENAETVSELMELIEKEGER